MVKSAQIWSLVIEIEPARMAHLKAIVESYDNLATLRTEDPARHRMRLWFDPAYLGDVEAILAEVALGGELRLVESPHQS